MYKKLLSIFLIAFVLFSFFTACKFEDKTYIDAQIRLISGNPALWVHKGADHINNTDNYKFCVTDLDQNGRLEVINSAIIGTGLYSESYYFEVDETYTTIVPWEHNTDSFRKKLEADIITDSADCFVNPESDERFFIFQDSFRETSAYNCNFKMCLTFENKTVTEKMLAYWENSAATSDESENYEIITNIVTADGEILTQDEFLNYADARFKNCEKHTVTFNWQKYDKDTFPSQDKLINLLAESYNGFNLK